MFYAPTIDVAGSGKMSDDTRSNGAVTGSALGKLEAALAIDALAEGFPNLRLIPDQELAFHPNISFRGPQAPWVQAWA